MIWKPLSRNDHGAHRGDDACRRAVARSRTRRIAPRALAPAGALALLGALLAPTAAPALEPVNQTRAGVAIEGHDPVTYFTDHKPVEGSPRFEHAWQGATWRFASAEHRDLFAAEPARYAPQYGGYCAYAVAQGKTAGIDPEAWSIVEGKLYLNYSLKIRATWEKDIPGYIAKADRNWPELLED